VHGLREPLPSGPLVQMAQPLVKQAISTSDSFAQAAKLVPLSTADAAS